MGDALREVERHALLYVERLEVGIRQQRRLIFDSSAFEKKKDSFNNHAPA
jgi:hypothetical protein